MVMPTGISEPPIGDVLEGGWQPPPYPTADPGEGFFWQRWEYVVGVPTGETEEKERRAQEGEEGAWQDPDRPGTWTKWVRVPVYREETRFRYIKSAIPGYEEKKAKIAEDLRRWELGFNASEAAKAAAAARAAEDLRRWEAEFRQGAEEAKTGREYQSWLEGERQKFSLEQSRAGAWTATMRDIMERYPKMSLAAQGAFQDILRRLGAPIETLFAGLPPWGPAVARQPVSWAPFGQPLGPGRGFAPTTEEQYSPEMGAVLAWATKQAQAQAKPTMGKWPGTPAAPGAAPVEGEKRTSATGVVWQVQNGKWEVISDPGGGPVKPSILPQPTAPGGATATTPMFPLQPVSQAAQLAQTPMPGGGLPPEFEAPTPTISPAAIQKILQAAVSALAPAQPAPATTPASTATTPTQPSTPPAQRPTGVQSGVTLEDLLTAIRATPVVKAAATPSTTAEALSKTPMPGGELPSEFEVVLESEWRETVDDFGNPIRVPRKSPIVQGFAGGGIVPGRRGVPQWAIVHGGEFILPTPARPVRRR